MVVKGLQTFVESIPGGIYSSNLRELIAKDSTSREGKPTVILDSSSICGCLESEMGFLYQGRPRIEKSKIEKLVEDIIACGANLIVIIRGNLSLYSDITKKKWSSKQTFINNALKKDNLSEALSNGLSSGLKFCHATTFSTIKSNSYEVYTSVKSVHEEVRDIVKKHNCLAVLGQDSNYLIYEGIDYFISLEKLNMETLDCQIYDKKKMLEFLGLQSYQLPLFATLCGNDIVPYYYLTNFRKKNCPTPDLKSNFLKIAEIVRVTSANPYNSVRRVVQLVNNPTVNESLVRKSLDMYLKCEENTNVNARIDFANHRKRMNDWGTAVYKMFVFYEFNHKNVSTFFEHNDQISLLRPLRQRVSGILLNDDYKPCVKEYSFDDSTNHLHKKPDWVPALKPYCEHPGLFKLWDKNTPNLNLLKWDLFCEPFESSLDYYNLRKIPLNLLFLVLALHYLEVQVPSMNKRRIFKKRSELEAYLVAALLLQADLHEPLLDNFQDDSPDLHVVFLNFCFIETVLTLSMLNEACGLAVPKQETCICNFYDGKLVHYVQKRMKEGASSNEFFKNHLALEVMFNALLEFILSGCN